ncbi:MAG: hypothetical protein ACI9SJ_001680 [Flavobacteriaceae bacterium]|jgi:hypothetical protein|uniref:hypothetical protein n=1 Tax=Candidatus Marifrigoribacter sp. Uisw_064 TaxID=3230970 RepID=UPI003ADABB40
MSKKSVSIFFSVIFLLVIVAPTVLVIVDNTFDISILYSSIEEEKGNEKHLDIESFLSKEKTIESDLVFALAENNIGYFYKMYPKPHLNVISPPPDLYIV